MKQLKIGFVLDDTLDTTDGVQQYVLTLGVWLSAQGHDVHYLVGNTSRTDIKHVHSLSRNVKVRFNGNRMSMPLPSSKAAIRKLLDGESFDILHIQMPYSPFMAGRVISAAPPRTAIIGTFHIAPNSTVARTANKALGLWTKRARSKFTRIVSVSPAAAEFAQEAYELETTVLPNVVDESRFRTALAFENPHNLQTIVFLGRLVPRKGCRVLLEAVDLLQNDPNPLPIRVIICGRGPLEAELKAYVRERRLEKLVEFVGFVTEKNKASYLKSADVAVFPSSGGESFGIVLIEAMAAEKPVVLGADNPGYASVLGPYPDLLFPVHNPEALANKLRVYLTDKDERLHALNWQNKYVKQFDVACVGEKLLEIYQGALRLG